MPDPSVTGSCAPASPLDTPQAGEYVAEPKPRRSRDFLNISHLNGVPWFEAPIPRRLHRCWVQTRGFVGLDLVERCACGAIRNPRFGRRSWMERNNRKAKDARPVPTTPYNARKQAECDHLDRLRGEVGQ